MYQLKRFKQNPLLLPSKDQDWDACAAFNPCVVKDNNHYHLLYRAQSRQLTILNHSMSLSTIGYAHSSDGVHFNQRRQLIYPQNNWETFGCEDPRITMLDGKYYIFYTALSTYPFESNGIRVGLAITEDFQTLTEKHPITPFNSKAMALFPEKINNKFTALLTVHTDMPPAKIAVVQFDREEQMWSEEFWEDWYSSLENHVMPLLESPDDHLEVGAPPVKTTHGWLMVYCYIKDYFTPTPVFNIKIALLDLKEPSKVIGKLDHPILMPEKEYELQGDIPNVIFPSGALIDDDKLYIYYGATDTTCCAASLPLKQILDKMSHRTSEHFVLSSSVKQGFKRYTGNPIIAPRPELSWEAKATFNPAAIYAADKFHLIYRAMSHDNTSVFGYASSVNGFQIDERLSIPIYEPTEHFEQKLKPGNSGCEDPRITKMGEHFYLFYTAFDGYTPRVAYTSILVDDFLNQQWHWKKAMAVTPPGIDDKDAGLLPRKINNKYVIFHRIDNCIRINSVDNLIFEKGDWLDGKGTKIKPRKTYWDNRKFGIAAPPIETEYGWLLFFHRISIPGDIYKIEALLLDRDNPNKVIAETDATLIEPETSYEKQGQVPNVVFPCGAVLHDKNVFLYYGGADQVVCVAKMKIDHIFKRLGL